LLAYEFGYRTQPHERFSLDLAAFYNVYDDLRSINPNSLSPTNTEFHPANSLYGETCGFEIAGTIDLARWWRLRPSYSLLSMQLHTRPGSGDTSSEQDEGKSPRNQVMIRSSMDLPYHLAFDVTARYVDRLKFSTFEIKSYWGLDVRLGWRPNEHWELAIGGQDLLYDHRAQFAPSFVNTQSAEIQRGVYGKVTLQF
jgi:iron complex outermembrane receptor protein